MIVAETKAQALDAAELVVVDYDPAACGHHAPTPPRAAGAPAIAVEVPGNMCLDWRTGDIAGVDGCFRHSRTCGHAAAGQPPHRHQPDGAARRRRTFDPARPLHAACLQPEHPRQPRRHRRARWASSRQDVRFIAPDVGGGFGAKNFAYAEHALILWAARRTGRPVKWIATRSRRRSCPTIRRATIWPTRRWRWTRTAGSWRCRWTASPISAPTWPAASGGVQTYQYPHLQGTVYAIPAIALHVRAVLTNTTPIGVTRGPGLRRDGQHHGTPDRRRRARQCGFDRLELRRRNCRRRRHADDQRFRLRGRQRRFPPQPSIRRWPMPTWPGSRPAAATARRGASCAAWASPITSRAPADRPTRTSTSVSSPTAACR